MKTIVTLSQKGGAGKTALTTNLSVVAQQAGYVVGAIDVDPQQSSAEWGDLREEPPGVISGQAGRLQKLLATAEQAAADIVLVDTPPGKNELHLAMARAADLIIVPCRPSPVDVKAVLATIDIATMANKMATVIFNGATATSPYLVEQARDALRSWGVSSAPVVVHQRVAFVTSFGRSRSVVEDEPQSKAADEIRQLFAWIGQQVDLKAGKPARRAAGQPVNA